MQWQQLPDSLSPAQLIRRLNLTLPRLEEGSGNAILVHGSNANFPRPLGGPYFWQGSVDPVNKQTGDVWFDTNYL